MVPPSQSPSDCSDDATYISPINKKYGCDLYNSTNCDCYTFKDLMTLQEMQELFSSCPKTCDVACDYRPVSPSSSPSISIRPTFNPSQNPSTSLQPTGCDDNPDYESPINCNLGCGFHEDAEFGCKEWSSILSQEETQELLTNCPRACGICG